MKDKATIVADLAEELDVSPKGEFRELGNNVLEK